MSLSKLNARARQLFGPEASVTVAGVWRVLLVPGHDPLRIGSTDTAANNALNLAETAGGISALRDGMDIRNPSWRPPKDGRV